MQTVHCQLSRGYLALFGVVIPIFVFFAAGNIKVVWLAHRLARDNMSMVDYAGWHYIAIRHLILALFFGCTALALGCFCAKWVLEAKRGAVAITDDTLTVIDWRGRETNTLWNNVRQLRITLCGGWCQPIITINTSGGRIRLCRWITQVDTIVSVIVEKANLKKEVDSWFRTIYVSAG